MRVVVWDYEGYDIAAPGSGSCWNYFAIVNPELVTIASQSVQVGPTRFELGQDYDEIGNGKKTSAGFFHLQLSCGYALRYVGIANGEYLLFRKVYQGVVQENFSRDLFGRINGRYTDVFFTYRILTNSDALFWLTSAGAGRVIEL